MFRLEIAYSSISTRSGALGLTIHHLENITENITKNNKNKESEEICLQQDLSALITKQQLSKTA